MRLLPILVIWLLGVVPAQTAPGPSAPAGPAASAAAPPGAAETPAAAQEPAGQDKAAPQDKAAGKGKAAGKDRVRRDSSLLERRILALDYRFPWLAPTESYQWVSLGVTLFALLSLAIHFAARLAASEVLGFGRATLIAGWIMLAGFIQLAILPEAGPVFALAVVANAVLLLLYFRIGYDLSVPASGLAVFLFAIEAGLGVALLRLVDATLRSIGNTTF